MCVYEIVVEQEQVKKTMLFMSFDLVPPVLTNTAVMATSLSSLLCVTGIEFA